jgi:hypothetical protein
MGISVGQETIMVANPSCRRENARVLGFIKKKKKKNNTNIWTA